MAEDCQLDRVACSITSHPSAKDRDGRGTAVARLYIQQ